MVRDDGRPKDCPKNDRGDALTVMPAIPTTTSTESFVSTTTVTGGSPGTRGDFGPRQDIPVYATGAKR
jgi:hypothetical protein